MANPFLDTNINIETTSGTNLNHWHQDGKLQFITFRLADSLPQSKIVELKAVKNQFEIEHPKPWDEKTKVEYYKIIGPVEEKLLDNGYGCCVLNNVEVRSILHNALFHYNGIKYDILSYVIMPNHVHLLIHMIGDNELDSVLHSIKSYSANAINNLLNRRGGLWMRENYDRIVRNEDHYKHCLSYIHKNPQFLRNSEYELYVKP